MAVWGGHIRAGEHSGLVPAQLSGSGSVMCVKGALPSLPFSVRGAEETISSKTNCPSSWFHLRTPIWRLLCTSP